MYQVGALIVYGAEGVCRVESVGPLEMRGAQKGTSYYTLAPLFRAGKISTPVDTTVYTRPVMTREEAEAPIDRIPEIPAEVYESNNPRLLNEHYQAFLKSYDCVDLVRLIRAIYAQGRGAAQRPTMTQLPFSASSAITSLWMHHRKSEADMPFMTPGVPWPERT